MTATQFDEVRESLLIKAAQIADAKRPGYTQSSSDVLVNFKTSGARVGITALQAWGVHFEKHVSAIMSRAKSADIPQAEDIWGRFADAVNYLALGLALIEEEQEAGGAARRLSIARDYPDAHVDCATCGEHKFNCVCGEQLGSH